MHIDWDRVELYKDEYCMDEEQAIEAVKAAEWEEEREKAEEEEELCLQMLLEGDGEVDEEELALRLELGEDGDGFYGEEDEEECEDE